MKCPKCGKQVEGIPTGKNVPPFYGCYEDGCKHYIDAKGEIIPWKGSAVRPKTKRMGRRIGKDHRRSTGATYSN